MPWEASRELLNHAFELLRETASYLLFVAHLGSQSRNRTSHTAVYADRLAKRGYDLLLVARRKERLDALGQELKHKYGVEVDTLVADLGNSADLKRVANALADDERITVLVNNAGTSAVKPSVDLPVSEVEHQMNVNAKAVTHLSLPVLPGFNML